MRKKNNKNRPNQKVKNNSFWKTQPKNKGWDTMSFEEREKERAAKKKERVQTKSFWNSQRFGAASEVRKIDPKEYKPDGKI